MKIYYLIIYKVLVLYDLYNAGRIEIIDSFIYIYIIYTEKAMAPHSGTLAWKISWMEEPGGLQSMGSLRVGHD